MSTLRQTTSSNRGQPAGGAGSAARLWRAKLTQARTAGAIATVSGSTSTRKQARQRSGSAATAARG